MLRLVTESLATGTGLAMDAFSVSLTNGLTESRMKLPRMAGMAAVFAVFQGLMPFIGWILVHNFLQFFNAFSPWIPWIALALLSFIGVKMLLDGLHPKEECSIHGCCRIGFGGLFMQGVATSIDALAVGFTIARYDLKMAIIASLLISAVTFFICFAGIAIGKKFGTKLSEKACIFGGIILIVIGIEIFVTSLF